MDHTAPKPQAPDARDGVTTISPVANPRRTRVGADGRPIAKPVAATDN
jgi:hypothetical protein